MDSGKNLKALGWARLVVIVVGYLFLTASLGPILGFIALAAAIYVGDQFGEALARATGAVK